MAPSAAVLLGREIKDANAARGILLDRVAVHEQSVADKDRQQAEHELRIQTEKAKREIARRDAKQAKEDRAVVERRERQMTQRVEELAARRASKEEERQRKEEEIDAELAEGAELLMRQQEAIEDERQRKWKEKEHSDRELADIAKQMHQSSQQQADLRLDDHRAIAFLFRTLDIDRSGFIEPDELQYVVRAIRRHGPPLPKELEPLAEPYYTRGTKHFRHLLREFDATVNGRITISGLRNWWDTNGVHEHGFGARAFRVDGTKKSGAGSAPAFVAQTLECMRAQMELESATHIQATVRRRKAQKTYRSLKTLGELPGSKRCAATKIQSFHRMRKAQKYYIKMRDASVKISKAIRRRHAMMTYRRHQAKKQADGYSFAARTVHVGGIGKEWEDEGKLTAWFERGGPILSVAVRKRPPEPNIPNNSWALVAFQHQQTVDNLLSIAGPASVDGEDSSGKAVELKADAADKTNDAVVFLVRRIDPLKAMSSVGSFGKTFQRCMQNMELRQQMYAREANARRRRLEARQARWQALAEPIGVRAQTKEEKRKVETAQLDAADVALRDLHARLDGEYHSCEHGAEAKLEAETSVQREQVILAEFADGWIQCCQWPSAQATTHNSSPTLVEMEQQGQPYYFNVRTGETRWLPPPSLTALPKTRARARHVRVAGAIPRIPRASGPAAGHIYTQTLQRPTAWHPSDEPHRAWQTSTARGQQYSLPATSSSATRRYTSPASKRPSGSGLPRSDSKQHRVIKQSQKPVRLNQTDGAALGIDIDPVAYMIQWQHRKYLSGPKTRELDCFAPQQAQRLDEKWTDAEQRASAMMPVRS